MRVVTESDVALLKEWSLAFERDCRLPEANLPNREEEAELGARRAVATGNRFLWIADGKPVAMAGKIRQNSLASTVAAVYTPPNLRGRGYASALVATLSEQLLAQGAPCCLLFADAENPTSNGIYQKIGYEPQGDFLTLFISEG